MAAKPKKPSECLNDLQDQLRHLTYEEWLEWLNEFREELDIRIEVVNKEIVNS